DNSIVDISNYWLKQANSKNYHHFFPKASEACRSKEWILVNNVLNITIIDDFLNKRSIGAKNPSDYMKKYIEINSSIQSTMLTHLIGDFDLFGIHTDKLDQFIRQRALLVSKKLGEKIIQRVSSLSVPQLVDDYE